MTALLPTLPGFTHGIVAINGTTVTVQCDQCGETRTDSPQYAFRWAPISTRTGERICLECRGLRWTA